MASEGERIAKKAVPRAQSVCSPQQSQETTAPEDIPPEAVKENMDVKDELVELAPQPRGSQVEKRKRTEWSHSRKSGLSLDPEMLSYLNKLFSQDNLINRVEEVIQSRFMAQLLSSDTQLDLVALAKELLELEEGLALIWLLEKLRLDEEEEEEEEEDEQAPQSDGALQCDSSPPESVASQDAQRDDHGPQLGVSGKACPPETDFKDGQRPGHADVHLSSLQAFAAPSGYLECPTLGAICPPSSPQSPRRTDSGLKPRDATIPKQVSPVRVTRRQWTGPVRRRGALPHLAFTLASPKSLSPSALSLSPGPASGLACPGGRGSRKAAQSQPSKRKSEQSVAGRGRKRKRYCSQRGAVGGPSCPQSGDPN